MARHHLWKIRFDERVPRTAVENRRDAGNFTDKLLQTFELAEQFIARAERSQDDTGLIISNRVIGFYHLGMGDFAAARANIKKSVALYDPDRHRSLAALYGQDARVAGLAILSQVMWLLGHPDQALASAKRAVDYAEDLKDEVSLTYALHHNAHLSTLRGDYDDARVAADRCVEIAEARGFPSWIATTRVIIGEIIAAQGDAAAGLVEAKAGFGLYEKLGARYMVPQLRATLARICAMAGATEEGLDNVENGLAEAAETGEQSSDPELLRLRAELTLLQAPDRSEQAEADLLAAIDRVKEQRSRSFELRAATDLARLWHAQSKSDDARALLAPVYEWFTEGFETADLQRAKALLDTL